MHEKHYSVKIGFIYFFSSSDKQKFPHLLESHAIGITSSLIFFLSALRFLNLLCQAKRLIIIIIASRSALSKLLSRLILLRFTVRIPIPSQQNVT